MSNIEHIIKHDYPNAKHVLHNMPRLICLLAWLVRLSVVPEEQDLWHSHQRVSLHLLLLHLLHLYDQEDRFMYCFLCGSVKLTCWACIAWNISRLRLCSASSSTIICSRSTSNIRGNMTISAEVPSIQANRPPYPPACDENVSRFGVLQKLVALWLVCIE